MSSNIGVTDRMPTLGGGLEALLKMYAKLFVGLDVDFLISSTASITC